MDSPESVFPEYAYDLPAELVAAAPLEERDASRLFVYEARKGIARGAAFSDLASFLPRGALLVINETKVVPARIVLSKRTGGRVEILFYINVWDKTGEIAGIADRKIVPGDILSFEDREVCAVVSQAENLFSFSLSIPPSDFLALLESKGVMPIPKYIKDTPLSEAELKSRYQTTFAANPGSVAAPTASLHFTPAVFDRLAAKGVSVARLTLHVGAGTFAPLTSREIASGKLHKEFFAIPKSTAEAVKAAKREGRPVIAVGTTALRALESAELADADGAFSPTEIFIRKPYRFKIADGLITNFHVPRSSLMCLVDAFLDWKGSPRGIVDLYRQAIKARYRFYSFGDAMLIL